MASKRRGQNEGSIFQRKDGRWAAAFSTGDGRRKTVYGRTRAEVANKLSEAQRAHHDGVLPTDGRLTVSAFAKEWLEGVQTSVRPKTAEAYEWAIGKHIVPRIGGVKLVKVGPRHLEKVYQEMRSDGKAPQTIRNVHKVAGTMFSKAVRLGLIARNPGHIADVPKVPKREPPMFDRQELQTFLAEARSHRMEALFALAVTSGARSGELLGLRWSDVEMEAGLINIRTALQQTRQGFALVEPKTKGSVRTLALSHVAGDALRRQRIRQNEEALRVGPGWNNDWNLVFTNEIGGPLDRKNVLRRDLKPLLVRAGLPSMTFQNLRHISGSLALDYGVPLTVVSQALGHTDLTTTARVYLHQIKGAETKVAAAFDAMMAVN